ncbi:MAG TPA: SDR family oxidoreductase [Bauldia sp.]|nr:SDR family oxidoreductase [Bauldia sp.]
MSLQLFDLSGRIALITGSSKGLGYAIAEGLAAAGAEVVLNSRNPHELEETRERLARGGHKAHAFAFDVTDEQAVEDAVARIERDIGPIAALFNNAGIQRRGPLIDFPLAAWREIMTGDLDQVFIVGRAVARRMLTRSKGRIVNTCSLTSEAARTSIAPYTTAKGAVKMLTKAMCVEWAPHGLNVNGIGPGYFKTELNRALFENPEFDAWLIKRTPAARWGNVDELKGAAIFLASDASSFVNGQVLYVDGGLLAGM